MELLDAVCSILRQAANLEGQSVASPQHPNGIVKICLKTEKTKARLNTSAAASLDGF